LGFGLGEKGSLTSESQWRPRPFLGSQKRFPVTDDDSVLDDDISHDSRVWAASAEIVFPAKMFESKALAAWRSDHRIRLKSC
jgi:hypothetical protein